MKTVLGMALALALSLPLGAQQFTYLAYGALAVEGTAVGFDSASPAPNLTQATRATCTLEDGNIRFTISGTTPTSSVGMLWYVGETRVISGQGPVQDFAAIRVSTSGSLKCTFSAP